MENNQIIKTIPLKIGDIVEIDQGVFEIIKSFHKFRDSEEGYYKYYLKTIVSVHKVKKMKTYLKKIGALK